MEFTTKDKLFIFYVIVSLLVIASLATMVGNNSKEGFRKCICSSAGSGREQDCQDTVDVNNLYVEGKLTESSQLPDKGWSTVSPGDLAFPPSQGCSWSTAPPPESVPHQWQAWDFTDFGN
jgi:hypothetical protein